jgi:flagellar basal body rod protein FlgG
MAVLGEGYFRVQSGSGEQYTRVGLFQPDAEGFLASGDGARLDPPVQIPDGSRGFSVSPDGVVSAVNGQGESVEIGRIQLYRFANSAGLLQEGGSRLAVGPNSGAPQAVAPGEGGTLAFGMVEGSNVDLTEEMVGLIVDENFFKANLRTLKAHDEMLGEILDLKA